MRPRCSRWWMARVTAVALATTICVYIMSLKSFQILKPPKVRQKTAAVHDQPFQRNIFSKWISGVKEVNIPPYVPLHKVLSDLRPTEYTKRKDTLIRRGFGLDDYVTENGEEAWIENGVVYRSYPYLEPAENKYYSAHFEPYIPFDPEVFFQGQREKVEMFKETTERNGRKQVQGTKVKRKIILWYIQKMSAPKLGDLQPLRMCPDLPCLQTSNEAYVEDSAAMISLLNTCALMLILLDHTLFGIPLSHELLSTGSIIENNKHHNLWVDLCDVSPSRGEWRHHNIMKPTLSGGNPLYFLTLSLFLTGQYIFGHPPARRPDQVLVYYQIEPPGPKHWSHGGPHRSPGWSSAFNWTMSYRLDSDVVTHYGLVRRRRKPRAPRNYAEILGNKTKLVAWITSNDETASDREGYVKELQKQGIDVDIFKHHPNCTRLRDPECTAMVGQKYKFYLALENSYCQNYITEKFYKYFDLDLVLITLGENEYSEIAPKETFINTADYKSPKELASRLKFLDSHDDAYLQILKEKDKYFSIHENHNAFPDGIFLEDRYEAVPVCHLCHRLWNLDRYRKTISNITEWYSASRCRAATNNIPDHGGFE
ncbi:uncharacterized protein LOC101864027 [Aplysia californica]|uniref:Fucosyltransferase n=1 Tax=Aplysia californica TaxID=6500 RepID=A0ABM1W213_APLCA|nr:uncharacterized protein LOC101864027 [Aplysia californica]